MATRIVTDTIRGPDGLPWPGFTLAFTVSPSTYHADAHYPHKTVRATTDDTGVFSIELVTDVRYLLDLETAFIRNGSLTGYPNNSKDIQIVVPAGDTPITLAEVRGLENIDPATPDVKSLIEQIIADYLAEHGGMVPHTHPWSEVTDTPDTFPPDPHTHDDRYVQPGGLAAVATSGDYGDLDNLPVLFDGDYESLDNTPTLGTAAFADTGDFASDGHDHDGTYVKPGDLSSVATSGDYTDLSNTPAIPEAQVPADWNASSGPARILNKPELFDGDYDSLANIPAIPEALADLDTTVTGSELNSLKSKVDGIEAGAQVNVAPTWSAVSGKPSTFPPEPHNHDGTYVKPADLADVATTGNYADLDGKPTIPAQFNPIAGTNVSLSGSYPNITINASGGGGGGSVDSVNGQTGVVVLDADDIDDASTTHKFATSAELSKLAGIEAGAEVNVQSDWSASSGDAQILNKPTLGTASAQNTDAFATAAQGEAADTAVQPGDIAGDLSRLANTSGTNTGDQDLSGYALSSSLGAVATSNDYDDLDNLPALFDGDYDSLSNKPALFDGNYNSLSGTPTLGSAAAQNTNAFATSAQGALADTAVQPGDLADVATSGAYSDLSGTPAIPDELADLDTTVTGSQLNSMKSKLDGIEAGAEVNVAPTWSAVSGKPSTFPPEAHNHDGTYVKPADLGNMATKDDVAIGDIDASGTPSSGTFLRGDGQWVTPTDTNTTYTELTEAEITAGTASTLRTMSGRRAQFIINKALSSLTGSIQFNLHGGGSAIEAGDESAVRMNFAGTITGWDVYSKQSGSIVCTVGKATHTNYPTFTAISGTAKPTLASANKAQTTTLTGWTTAFAAGDVIRMVVDSATTVEDVYISLRYTRTA